MATLKSKLSSDHLATSSLQSNLEDRQREYVGLRKHYEVIEDAIRGTAYVQEIQERVQKAEFDADY